MCSELKPKLILYNLSLTRPVSRVTVILHILQNSAQVNSIAANIAQRKAKHDLLLSILCEILLLLHTTSVNKVKKYRCKSILLRRTSGYNLFDGFPIKTSIVTRKFYWDSKQIRPILESKALHRWQLESTFLSFDFVVHSMQLSAEIKQIFSIYIGSRLSNLNHSHTRRWVGFVKITLVFSAKWKSQRLTS